MRRGGWCRAWSRCWSDDAKREGTSRVTWEIEPVAIRGLTVTHDQLREGANEQLYGGPMLLSGLKTRLETGELLTTPGSMMYGAASAR